MKALLNTLKEVKVLLTKPQVWVDVIKNTITGALTTIIIKMIVPLITRRGGA